ncbi:MAG: ethanolamine permease [bacterium]|nr:ethanolamine permease [bacterium]
MGDEPRSGVRYQDVEDGYFERRGLRRYAGVWSLWALGVGAVISGDFFGWNFGLAAGGFGGLLIATGIVTLMYIGLCDSIAEMSPALPHTGGAYSFGRSALGPWGGFVTGLAENMEYVLTPAVIVVGIGGYLGAVFGTPAAFEPGWWVIAYTLFVGLNVWGVEASFRFTVCITFLALAILVVFYVGAIAHFDLDHALDIAPREGGSRWLPFGWKGVLAATPFAVWFFLAIEQLPLAAEEAHDPKRDMPRGILLGLFTLILCAVLTLFLNAGIPPGAAAVGASDEPLFLAFQTIFGDGIGSKLLALVAVAGLIASFHTIVYAYGRNIYSLSRSGYFPKWLSVTHASRSTPHVALIAGAVVGFVVALVLHFQQDGLVGAALLNMAVFGAVIAYVMQMIAFVRLRRDLPHIERPYVSRTGVPGAVLAGVIATIILVYLLYDESYRPGIVGCLLWFLAGIGYFAVRGRHGLVRSPEEEFAIESQRRR